MKAEAELISDRGAAAESDDFFRSPRFHEAEGVTDTLRLEADGWGAAVALIVREVEGSELRDATSAYAYPGARVSTPPARGDRGEAPRADDVDWGATGLVSIFARERVGGEPWLASPTHRSDVLVHDPAIPRRVRPRLEEQVRAASRRGWEVSAVPGPESDPDDRTAFAAAYEQTMRRAGAAERYFFAPSYFESVLADRHAWLVLARRAGDRVGAGAIAAVSDGFVHYYLGGTADEALGDSPFKNVVVAMLDLADRLAVPLNLGGGVSPGDGLEAFKRGFANATLPFRTHEVICDPAEYARLAAGRDESGSFFPAYRGPPAG